MAERFVSDSLDIMRRTLGRNNAEDPDSSDEIFLSYINDAVVVTMNSDFRLFEQFDTLSFIIDETHTDGVYTFNDVGASKQFVSIGQEAFISLLNPVNNSISWNVLPIYQDPGQFFTIWGINNTEILIPGYPTMMLLYGNQFTFRTIPEQEYLINIYGYKKLDDFPDENTPLPYDFWVRYIGKSAAFNYAQDFRYEDSAVNKIQKQYSRERKILLTHTHNQIKNQRCLPRF